MAGIFNQLIAKTLPLVPKPIVGKVARRYIAGDTREEAVKTAEAFKSRGFDSTIDFLGEEVTENNQVDQVVEEYFALIETLGQADLQGGISLKLTQLGIRLDESLCRSHLVRIAESARAQDIFVRVDMEDVTLTSTTLDMVHSLRAQGHANLGTVIQSYLFRTATDVEERIREGTNLRICKGIYQESPTVSYHHRKKITENFIRQGKRMLLSGQYVGLATHDFEIIDAMCAFVAKEQIPSHRYEFQSLMGVPITARLSQLVDAGHRVRLYLPYGAEWYAYSVRRLQENPDMAGNVMRGLLRRDR